MYRENNDWARGYPTEKTLDIEGKKIFITHGHNYNVKYDYQRIAARGRGHWRRRRFFSGIPMNLRSFSRKGMLVLNPGSIGGISPGLGKPVYCVVEIANEKIISRYYGI